MTNDGHRHPTATCHVCRRQFPASDLRPWISVRPGVSALIVEAAAGWGDGKFICREDLGTYRRLYVEQLLEQESGDLGELDRQVIASLESGEYISQNPEAVIEEHATFGEQMAYRVASYGGSWGFVLIFTLVLIGWVSLNSLWLATRPFDPYPYILLNLVLSSLAAIQAPVIISEREDFGRFFWGILTSPLSLALFIAVVLIFLSQTPLWGAAKRRFFGQPEGAGQ